MGQILINKDALADKITELENLRNQCNNHSAWRKRETEYGSGEVADLLDSIDREYCSLMDDFDALFSNSISFFNNVLTSVKNADLKAKNNF